MITGMGSEFLSDHDNRFPSQEGLFFVVVVLPSTILAQ